MHYKFLPASLLSFILACQSPTSPTKREQAYCLGNAAYCSEGIVTKIVDGDTLYTDKFKIRLVLVDAPERDQKGGPEATNYLGALCPVSSQVLIDQDDRQLRDRHGRTLAVAWCSGRRANERMIADGYASLYKYYCSRSEFGAEEWAKRLGCS